ncbi:FKBP-type peptidyl-prolyl cis-trans isomerase N-terminal domain-containing protein [Serratia liquefaciens]|uniref:FKBP-type peptidyl-prolyl cis-trans isomerase N-terminal domain-containing protein n=1 Tax=Serratia liquefaciens TaxID=614 RepID=UPI00217ACF12|nr:FKBP-type peptidyl-prolyl cis-trans isomerase N-terminal domain-containing protein [Serratia liquefaciens]CAI1036261.1 FKBP-type peptidyl-prolyl cis-trans isomerase fkpA precursor [Serratia liquefaciens]
MISGGPACRALAALLGSLLLSTASSAASHNNKVDIPALLQFAEQYTEQTNKPKQPSSPPRSTYSGGQAASNGTKTSPDKPTRPRSEYWQIKDKEIQRQNTEITQLKAQVTHLQQRTATTATTLDLATLGKLAQGLRQALAITPTERQAKASIAQIQELWDRDRAALQQQLSRAKADNQALSAATNSQKNLLMEAKSQAVVLREKQEEMSTQRQLIQAELDNTIKELANARADSASLQARSPRLITGDALKATQPREDYAAGVSLGEEILQMQEERRRWGVTSDKQMILAGIADTFAGKRMLADDELNKILATAEKKVTVAREKISVAQRQKGAAYTNEFKKDKRVRQAPSGFWYRIDYAGDAQIPNTASVDVVVKETLTDGTVIQDMEANGATLSQPVADFPPLFKEAISLLKNHGSMTLIVPPELAYGDKGYPPKVPPNATMIYTLRIAEMYPEAQAKKREGS